MPPPRAAEPQRSTERGSFRDPDSRVFLRDGAAYRALSRAGWEDWEALLGERFEVERSERLASGTRMLYEARPRM